MRVLNRHTKERKIRMNHYKNRNQIILNLSSTNLLDLGSLLIIAIL